MPAITSQPDAPGWDVDADWWGPAWDVVTPVGAAEPGHLNRSASGVAREPADQAVPVPAVSHGPSADPSWGRILATTVGLWMSRRSAGGSSGARPGGVSDPDSRARLLGLSDSDSRAGHGGTGPSAPISSEPDGLSDPGESGDRAPGRPRSRPAGWVSAAWGAHARLLSAAMLGAGLLAIGAGTAGLMLARPSSPPAVRLAPVATPTGRTVMPIALSAAQQTPKPVTLTIPAIGVKAPIINLGLNRNGTLQVPSTTTVVGWYTGSPRPGATGSAIIAGHVDSYTGPGVFYWLRKMRPGERIYVRRADGTLAVFTVTVVRMYPKNDFPTTTVYGPVPDAELRLITCGGTFDYATRHYLSNVVVYARLST
jgi:sortase (surface protein transpeptidase)